MINFEQSHFQKMSFSKDQIDRLRESAVHDLVIAKGSDIPDVVFKFCYDGLLKLGILVIAKHGYKVRSIPGHHVKILEKLSQILKNDDVLVLGNKMRQERNGNLYDGSCFVGDKDSREYLAFVKQVFLTAGIQ